jgi:hypothetical protein
VPSTTTVWGRCVIRRATILIATIVAHFDIDRWEGRSDGHTTLICIAGHLLVNGFLCFLSEFLSGGLVPILAIRFCIGFVVSLVIGGLAACAGEGKAAGAVKVVLVGELFDCLLNVGHSGEHDLVVDLRGREIG